MNITGLTIAFAACAIILMQVRYDLSFDKSYPDAERIFQVDLWGTLGTPDYYPTINRDKADEMFDVSPHVVAGAYTSSVPYETLGYERTREVGTSLKEKTMLGSNDLPSVFGLECMEGNFGDFSAPETAIIAESSAKRIFGEESPIGKILVMGLETRYPEEVQIVAMYKDVATNATVPNGVIQNIGNFLKNSGSGNWDFHTYLLLDSPKASAEVEALITEKLQPILKNNMDAVGTNVRPARLINLGERFFVKNNKTQHQGSMTAVFSLLGIAGLILLIAIINFINFATSLVPLQIRNINTRKVLGSSNVGLRLQQVGQAVFLSVLSAVLATGVIHVVSRSGFSSYIEADMALSANLPLLSIMFAIAVLSGVFAALYPAVYSTSFSPALVLKGSFGLSPRGKRLRTGMISLQYCISLILIICALFIRQQYTYMQHYDTGMNRDEVVTTLLTSKMHENRSAVVNRLKENPAIRDVAFSSHDVAAGIASQWGRSYRGQKITTNLIRVTSNFPSVMGIEIQEGRNFRESDDQKTVGTYIFNETAQKEFGLEVGTTMQSLWRDDMAEIVGIAKDFNYKSLHYNVPPIALYVWGNNDPYRVNNLDYMYIRADMSDLRGTLEYIRRTLLEFNPGIGNGLEINLLSDKTAAFYEKEKRQSALITAFSLLAVLISTIGAFGLVLFEVQYRRGEIGVRKVFGATVRNILTMFNRQYVIIVVICFGIAAPIAYYIITRWLENFAYQAPVTVWVFLFAFVAVLFITMTTVTLQSYRAATENPAHSIKAE